MSDWRHVPSDLDHHFWAKHTHHKIDLPGAYSLKMPINRWEVGYDRAFRHDDQTVLWGASLNLDNHQGTLASGRTKIRGLGLALYRSALFENGWFVNTVARLNRYQNTLDSNFNNQPITGRFNQWGYSLALETGKRWDLGSFYVEPQIEASVGQLTKAKFSQKDIAVDNKAIRSVITRIGTQVGHTFNQNRGEVFAKANLFHQFAGNAQTTLNVKNQQQTIRDKGQSTWAEFALGINYQVTRNVGISGSVSATANNPWGQSHGFNIGADVRY